MVSYYCRIARSGIFFDNVKGEDGYEKEGVPYPRVLKFPGLLQRRGDVPLPQGRGLRHSRQVGLQLKVKYVLVVFI